MITITEPAGRPDIGVDYKELRENLRGEDVLPLGSTVRVEVEFALAGHKPVDVRRRGEPPRPPRQRTDNRDEGESEDTGGPRALMFHNPYNFVPAPPRRPMVADKISGPLGDCFPAGHASYAADLYSGRITVEMVAETPLLVHDAMHVETATKTEILNNGSKLREHQIYPIRRNARGEPVIAPTGIQGMLTSAYEAVTNSRLRNIDSSENKRPHWVKAGQAPLHPGPIDVYPVPPCRLLPPSLRPAPTLGDLSPADRVFGWVRSGGAGSYRGHLWIGPVRSLDGDAIVDLTRGGDPEGIALAILGQPKDKCGRFYAAANVEGAPFPKAPAGMAALRAAYPGGNAHDLDKIACGRAAGGLRGRKVYPHHRALPANYWQQPMGNARREFARPADEQRFPGERATRDHQNRSILGWIRPGARFTFDVRVINLSRVELGALLWLLSLPTEHFHRFGGGKPLGFGSVRLDISGIEFRDGASWADYYRTIAAEAPAPEFEAKGAVDSFKGAVVDAYSEPSNDNRDARFFRVPFIAAFARSCQGFPDNLPVNYPRRDATPQARARNYEWFVANAAGRQLSLPALENDHGLPFDPR